MDDVTQRMTVLLEAERDALLAGDLDRVAALMSEKQALADGLAETPLSVEVLAPLRDRIERNQRLFDRALEGVRAVVARLGSLEEVRKAFNTYDSRGQRQALGQPASSTMERRA